MSELFTGHEAEIKADAGVTYTKKKRAISRLQSAIQALTKESYLDFLPAPTDAEMRDKAIRNIQTVIRIMQS